VVAKNLQIAAAQAGLTPLERDKVETFSKIVDSHKNLLDMPVNEARIKFQSLPADQQQSLTQAFGVEEEPKRGPLGTAFYYASRPVVEPVKAVFKGLTEVSDFMTRAYRTAALANEKIPLGSADYYLPKNWSVLSEAWQKSNDNGELLYNETRINKATKQYGSNYVSLAQKVSEGRPLSDFIANGTEEEKQIAKLVAKNEDPMWQKAYDSVVAAKYSPGRQTANALLPESLEGTGFLYKGISGTVDTAYRLFADPTLALGKAKKAYDVAQYSLFKIVGDPKKLDEAFTNPKVVNFFNSYGPELEKLGKARKAKDIISAEQSSTMLRRIAPEFGPAAIDEFVKAGVKNADTAKAYFQNNADMIGIFKGQAARETPLVPRLTAGRKARIAALTTGNKVINIDKVGQNLVRAMYGGSPEFEDVLTGITLRSEDIAARENQLGRFFVKETGADGVKGSWKTVKDGALRMPMSQIQGRLDRFARKFTKIPNPTSTVFDVMGTGAADEIYRTARLTNSRYHSKIIAEAFAAGDEGQRMQITKGLWNTIFSSRGVRKNDTGKSFMDEFAGKGLEKRYAADMVIDGRRVGNPAEFNGEQLALFPYQLSSSMVIPSILQLDRLTAREGLMSKLIGLSNSRPADKITSGWTFLTLAGPRFVMRNAIEDSMFFLARGRAPWDLVKGKIWSTGIRTSKGISGADTGLQKLKDTVFLKTEAGELGAINKFLLADELQEFSVKMAKASNEDEVRSVMAEALLRRKLGYKLDPEASEIIADVAKYGNLDDTLRDVIDGGKNGVRGGGRYQNIADDVNRFGKMDAVRIDGKAYERSLGDVSFTNFNPVANEQARVSWLFQLGVMANDDLGRIAIKHLENEKKAIDEMFKYLKSLPQRDRDKFQLYFKGADEYTHAQRAYLAVHNLFARADGNLNRDLLSKVKKTDADGYIKVSTKELRLSDLPNDPSNAPVYISGPTLVPVTDADNFAGSLFEKGWNAMGESNGRWTREPIVLNELVSFRKQLDESGYSKKVIDQFTAGKTDEAYEKAYKSAKQHINTLAEDLAKEHSLAYVDNPAVRSQLAMAGRNLSRFFRATEDFYRRFYRTVRYNPEAITRASLTYDGISHSGFVQTDDSGEQYFFYPGTTAMYQAVGNVMEAFGQQEGIKAPMPIEFSAKLKMITPSANPDSLFPTFAGPISAVSMKAIFALVPGLDKLERVFLGQYGEDQPMISAIFPAHINRFIGAMDKDERNSQYASATRKAIAYLEATGHGLKPKVDPITKQEIPISAGELEEYKDKLAASTFTALILRFVLGFVVPASPQTTLKSEIATWVRQNGETNFKQTFNNLVEKTGSYDKAMEEWIRLFPKEMPYTVSESESTVVAILSANKNANQWVDKNSALIKQYPEAAGFFIPKEGEFDFDAYKLLMNMGLKESKTVRDYLRQANTAYDEAFYYEQQDLYEEQLANTFGDYGKRNLTAQWDSWASAFKKARPNLQEELGQGAERAIRRTKALSDLTLMLSDKNVKLDPAVRQPIEGMLTVYNDYINARDSVFGNTESANNYKDLLKQRAKDELERLSRTNRNAEDAYFALFSKLIRN
jgi:hypothetical protein